MHRPHKMQFSLAAMMTVVTGASFAFGLGIPAYHAARTIAWDATTAGWLVAICCFAAAGVLLAAFRR